MSIAALPIDTPVNIWHWRGFPIAYQHQGETGPAVVLVHGFGASWGHWRKNIPSLAQHCRCYAIDLLGFGASAKPRPNGDVSYTFETWGALVVDFCREVIGEPAILIGNSIGCIVVMQAAVMAPDWVIRLAALNCSLRLLHERKRQTLPWYRQVGATVLQSLLKSPAIGNFFFQQIAQAKTVRKALLQAYRRSEVVTDELVTMLLCPAQDEGAAAVFLAFTGYSQGPLAEDLLPQIRQPLLFLWGEADPWEPLALGYELADYECVTAFEVLPGVGHCPQDEAPELVNPRLIDWILTS